jgi:hypothetical protein
VTADFNIVHLLILSLAAYRVTRLIIEDVILERPREAIWKKYPPSTLLGYWLTCYWCAGFAVSVVMILFYWFFPIAAIIVAAIFAVSAVVGIIDHLMNR